MSTVAIPTIADPILHGAITISLTLLADAEDLCGMANVSETMLLGYFQRPLFDSSAFNLNRLATTLANQVVVMALST
jgi:hypothetical protein